MSETPPKKMMTLKSSDGELFKVEQTAMAEHSRTIKLFLDHSSFGPDYILAIPAVPAKILTKVIEYCTKHAGGGGGGNTSNEELELWDAEFVKDVDQDTLFALIEAAKYLDIKTLFDLALVAVAGLMKDKPNPEEERNKSMNTARTMKVTLRTIDGEEFKVDEAVAKMFIDEPNFAESKPMCLPVIITGKSLSKVIEYCEKHVRASSATATTSAAAATNAATSSDGGGVDELKEWDEQFVNAMDRDTLFGLQTAANYLGIRSLFELASSALAELMPAKDTLWFA